PKWDGFRTLVFRDGDEVLLQSRDEKPLNRYFPELIDPLRVALPERCVLDGEIVVVQEEGLDFDALQLRIHPATSRVQLLSKQLPASIVFFDLLSEGDTDLRNTAFAARTPPTQDFKVGPGWVHRFEGAGVEGVMAKQAYGIYEQDKRVMLKVKHERD